MARNVLTALFVLGVVLALSTSSSALPSFRGYTGLLLIPTADALDRGEWNVGLFSEDVSENVTSYIATYGLDEGLEVGINSFEPIDNGDRETLFSGKYRFLTETDDRPAVAAGIIDLTDEVETTAYIVASKAIDTPLGVYNGEIINPRVHIGFGAGQFSSLFVGISTYLGNRLQVMTEWDSDNWHAGAKLRVTPGLTVHAGFFDISEGTEFGLGASFSRLF